MRREYQEPTPEERLAEDAMDRYMLPTACLRPSAFHRRLTDAELLDEARQAGVPPIGWWGFIRRAREEGR